MLKLWSLLLCACLTLTACLAVESRTGSEEVEFNRLTPEGERTHEEIVSGMREICASARDSFDRMLADAQGKGEREAQAAREVRDQYARRLDELEALDYDAMADAEIYGYMEEISGILTAIREARDVIGGLD